MSPASDIGRVMVRALPETETMFEASIMALARLMGWAVYHTHNSRHSSKGFPDLCLAKPGKTIYAEVKNATRKVTPEQWDWLWVLQHNGLVECYVWRPHDFPEIERVLTAR